MSKQARYDPVIPYREFVIFQFLKMAVKGPKGWFGLRGEGKSAL
jgi:hypothetical protein